MAITATEAYEAMRAHHKALSEELAGRADAVSGAAAAGLPHGAPWPPSSPTWQKKC